jgi:hypothetical protein
MRKRLKQTAQNFRLKKEIYPYFLTNLLITKSGLVAEHQTLQGILA